MPQIAPASLMPVASLVGPPRVPRSTNTLVSRSKRYARYLLASRWPTIWFLLLMRTALVQLGTPRLARSRVPSCASQVQPAVRLELIDALPTTTPRSLRPFAYGAYVPGGA